MINEFDSRTQENILYARTLNGIPPHHSLVPYRSVKHMLENRVQETPDKVYLIHYDADGSRHEFTYGELNARVNQIANFLVAHGVKRGNRVATIAHNHSDTVMIYFACWKIGAAVAPQNVSEDDSRIAYILRNSESVLVLVRPEYLERAETIVHGTENGLGADNIR
ncbi:MAG: acyl--CoA ligase, partial [Anaerolineae bacterium]|nr:acyl--CoA ligase [Anaerolineae bacterium]